MCFQVAGVTSLWGYNFPGLSELLTTGYRVLPGLLGLSLCRGIASDRVKSLGVVTLRLLTMGYNVITPITRRQ